MAPVDERSGPNESSVSYIRRGVVLRAIAVVGLVAGVAVVLVPVFGADAFGLIEEGYGDTSRRRRP